MPLPHTVLAFLDYGPMTGYDMKKYFDESVAHFWSATQSHIYKALSSLEEKKWVRSKIMLQQGRPNRKVYHITESGKTELSHWLSTPLPIPPVREAWLIQIFFSNGNNYERVLKLLQDRHDTIYARAQRCKHEGQDAIKTNTEKVSDDHSREMWQITLDYGVDSYLFELEWLRKTMDHIRKLADKKEE